MAPSHLNSPPLTQTALYAEQIRLNHQDSTSKRAGSRGWNPATLDIATVLENPIGVDPATVEDSAGHILGKSVSDFLDGFQNGELRVVHVEPVHRPDLVASFFQRQAHMKKELMQLDEQLLRTAIDETRIKSGEVQDSVEGIAEYLVKPVVSYHGAHPTAIRSIVRYGFTMPGAPIGNSGKSLSMRFDSASFGKGIYSSPDPYVAIGYTYDSEEGEWGPWRNGSDYSRARFIVCATLLGLALTVNFPDLRDTTGPARPYAHSHISDDKKEYVVFDPAQTIPCYVLHVDDGAESVNLEFVEDSLHPDSGDMRECVDAQIAEKIALQASWFDEYQTFRNSNEVLHVETPPRSPID